MVKIYIYIYIYIWCKQACFLGSPQNKYYDNLHEFYSNYCLTRRLFPYKKLARTYPQLAHRCLLGELEEFEMKLLYLLVHPVVVELWAKCRIYQSDFS